jgi:hypothetical protein
MRFAEPFVEARPWNDGVATTAPATRIRVSIGHARKAAESAAAPDAHSTPSQRRCFAPAGEHGLLIAARAAGASEQADARRSQALVILAGSRWNHGDATSIALSVGGDERLRS